MPAERSPHLTADETRRLAEAADGAENDDRREIMTRLAWRPAWAIRRRHGVIAALRDMFRSRSKPD